MREIPTRAKRATPRANRMRLMNGLRLTLLPTCAWGLTEGTRRKQKGACRVMVLGRAFDSSFNGILS